MPATKQMKWVQWDGVIADVEAQIAELNAALKTLKKIRSLGANLGVSTGVWETTASSVFEPKADNNPPVDSDIRSDAFFKMTIAEAAIKFLRKWANRTPQPTKAIIAALARGGIKGKNYQTVYKVLTRRAKEKNDVINVHGDWGLPEWYGTIDDGTQQAPPPFSAAALRDQQG
jgi:hypothetical protein